MRKILIHRFWSFNASVQRRPVGCCILWLLLRRKTMTVKIIKVEGKPDFPCPIDWTVEQAKNEIKSGNFLVGGFLLENGEPLLGNTLISSTTGALLFTGGQPQQGDFNILFMLPSVFFSIFALISINFSSFHLLTQIITI